MDVMIHCKSVGKQLAEVFSLEQLYISHVILINLFETFYLNLVAKFSGKLPWWKCLLLRGELIPAT